MFSYAIDEDVLQLAETMDGQLLVVSHVQDMAKRTANPSCQVAAGQPEVSATQRWGDNSAKRAFAQIGNLVNLVNTSFR